MKSAGHIFHFSRLILFVLFIFCISGCEKRNPLMPLYPSNEPVGYRAYYPMVENNRWEYTSPLFSDQHLEHVMRWIQEDNGTTSATVSVYSTDNTDHYEYVWTDQSLIQRTWNSTDGFEFLLLDRPLIVGNTWTKSESQTGAIRDKTTCTILSLDTTLYLSNSAVYDSVLFVQEIMKLENTDQGTTSIDTNYMAYRMNIGVVAVKYSEIFYELSRFTPGYGGN